MRSYTQPPLLNHLARIISALKRWPTGPDVLIFTTAFGLYIKTLCPSVYTFDSAEMVAGAYSLGIVHATGYPLYLMLAKLFTLIVPLGDIAYRVNLFSALCAALTLVVLRRVALIITRSPSSAFLATALLGASFPFWSEALVAEVYTLHVLFLSSILWLVLCWRATGKRVFFISLGLVLGLSFGNHMATSLILPGMAVLALEPMINQRVPVPGLRIWITTGVASLIGPLTYLYLPIRYAANPGLNYAALIGVDLQTVEGVLWMMRGEMFMDLMFAYPLSQIPHETRRFLELLWQTFLGVGPILAAVGLWNMWRRDRILSFSLILLFLTNVIFYVNYRVLDKDTMFLPAFLVFTLWMADGLLSLKERLVDGITRQVVSWGALVLLLIMLVVNYPRVDLSGNWITRQYAEEVFQQVPPNSFIIGGWIDIIPLEYLQIVESQRPDVSLFDYGLFTLGRRSALKAEGYSQEDTWRIAQNEIRQVVSSEVSNGRLAFSLGENTILDPAFELEPISEWLYAITPANQERLRP